MALPQYTIEFHQGETFELAITYKDSTGCALDLSGSTAYDAKIEGRATADGSVVWTVNEVASSGNVITLSKGSPNIHVNLTKDYTATLSPGSGIWDLKLTQSASPHNIVTYVLGGEYTILDPVTA